MGLSLIEKNLLKKKKPKPENSAATRVRNQKKKKQHTQMSSSTVIRELQRDFEAKSNDLRKLQKGMYFFNYMVLVFTPKFGLAMARLISVFVRD